MEAERQKFVQDVTFTKDGRAVLGPDRPVTGVEKFEYGMPNDELTKVIGGGYLSSYNPDFLQTELGRDGTCARFYFDKKIIMDIGDPDSVAAKKKRKLCFKNGIGYLCIPVGFEKNESKLQQLYEASIEEYYQYEKAHPRPAVVQEAITIGTDGVARRALLTAIDTKVGGGVTGNVQMQQKELDAAKKLSKDEMKALKRNAKLHRKIRECLQSGKPLRNPFIGPNKRLYAIKYSK